jgi:mono/diheme cytochrome c family protein
MRHGYHVAIAVFVVALAGPSAIEAQQGGGKAAFALDAAKAKAGDKLYRQKGCAGCHNFGKGGIPGTDLNGLLQRRDIVWLRKWLGNTTEMIATDPIAKKLVADAKGMKMPDSKLNEADADAVIHYIASKSSKEK